MKTIFLTFLLVVFCLSTSHARPSEENEEVEKKAEVEVKVEKRKEAFAIPTINKELVREVLKDKQKTRKMVDCVLDFDEDDCPSELKNVNKMAPEIFRRGGRCYRCSKEDKKRLKQFLVDLQRSQPSEYRRMIRQLNKI